ncbi:MAG: hypothetical protein KCHDKBKB_02866 [Elusimicrobia bacterium]|nr:hypothetical protein [Elusimicrobiota bacterium]
MKSETLTALSQTVQQALMAGGNVVRRGIHGVRHISYKSSTDPVTQVDRASEKAIVKAIRKNFPSHAFLGEETTFLNKTSFKKREAGAYRWIADPLDGTVNFIHRIPHFCVSVAVEREGMILAGGVYDPHRDELFMAVRGKGATLNGKKIQVSKEQSLIRSLLVTGFPYDHQQNAAMHAAFIQPFLNKFADLRRFGAAALDLSWVACGRVEAYWEFSLKPWDVAAGWLLVEEAGGRISDFLGRPLQLSNPKETLATNGPLHPAVVKIFKWDCCKSKPLSRHPGPFSESCVPCDVHKPGSIRSGD